MFQASRIEKITVKVYDADVMFSEKLLLNYYFFHLLRFKIVKVLL